MPRVFILLVVTFGLGVCISTRDHGSVLAGEGVKAKVENSPKPTLVAKIKHRFELPSNVDGVVFSPDGKLLAAGTEGSIIVLDLTSGKEKMRLNCRTGKGFPRAFSSDGKHLLGRVLERQPTIRLWEVSSGREMFSFAFLNGGVQFTQEDKQIVCLPFYGKIQYRDAKDGVLIREIPGGVGRIGGSKLSVDGTLLAESLVDKTISMRHLDSGKETILKGVPGEVTGFSMSGKLLSCSELYSNVTTIWDTQKGEILQKVKFAHTPLKTAISPDDRWLAGALARFDDTIAIHEIATGRELLTFECDKGKIRAFEFGPKGSLLARARQNVIEVWELSEQKAPAAD